MYTVEDRESLFQATLRQILELSEKAKQRRFIGLNEALLRDLLRAGLSCPAFNERQKICLFAASELPPLQPIDHHEPFEFWPFDCLVKQPKANDYEVMVRNTALYETSQRLTFYLPISTTLSSFAKGLKSMLERI